MVRERRDANDLLSYPSRAGDLLVWPLLLDEFRPICGFFYNVDRIPWWYRIIVEEQYVHLLVIQSGAWMTGTHRIALSPNDPAQLVFFETDVVSHGRCISEERVRKKHPAGVSQRRVVRFWGVVHIEMACCNMGLTGLSMCSAETC